MRFLTVGFACWFLLASCGRGRSDQEHVERPKKEPQAEPSNSSKPDPNENPTTPGSPQLSLAEECRAKGDDYAMNQDQQCVMLPNTAVNGVFAKLTGALWQASTSTCDAVVNASTKETEFSNCEGVDLKLMLAKDAAVHSKNTLKLLFDCKGTGNFQATLTTNTGENPLVLTPRAEPYIVENNLLANDDIGMKLSFAPGSAAAVDKNCHIEILENSHKVGLWAPVVGRQVAFDLPDFNHQGLRQAKYRTASSRAFTLGELEGSLAGRGNEPIWWTIEGVDYDDKNLCESMAAEAGWTKLEAANTVMILDRTGDSSQGLGDRKSFHYSLRVFATLENLRQFGYCTELEIFDSTLEGYTQDLSYGDHTEAAGFLRTLVRSLSWLP